jgi:hypothetical protein
MKTRAVILWGAACLMVVPWTGRAIENQTVGATPSAAGNMPVQAVTGNPAKPERRLTGVLAEVTNMVEAKTDPAVIRAFIKGWTTPYSVSADEILHLHDLGASTEVLTALISRSAELQAQAPPPPRPYVPDLVTTNMPPAVLYPYPEPATPMDTNTPGVPSPYTTPSYSYPAYTYSYLYPSWPYSPYSYYPYWSSPYWYSWPYYGRYYYPYRYGYGFHYGYPGWGYHGGWHGGGGYHGWHGYGRH